MTVIRKARRYWHCCMCGRTIPKGYFYGQCGASRECYRCVEIDPHTGQDQ